MSQLDDLIGRCDAALSHGFDEDECMGIAADYYLAYDKQIGIETNATIDPRRGPIDHATIRSIRFLLVAHRERMEHELAVANAGASTASLSSEVNVSVSVTLSQTVEAIDRCDVDDEEMSRIKAAVADLEASKGKSPETICDKASKLLDLAKKGVDVAKAVAPYVAMALQGMS